MQWEIVNYCEFDKYASKSYQAIHGVDGSLNLGDITEVNEKEIKDFNLMTWGFPCQDISLAGKCRGFVDQDGNRTRSGMYYEGIRILREKKPEISIIENVKNLVSKKFKAEFDQVISDLDEAGYNNYWEVLNAKNYGIPQNRERVFIVSIRKDIDNGNFKFPEPFELDKRLKDLLETEVDKKYYLNDKTINRILAPEAKKHQKEILQIKNATKQGYLEATDGDGCYISNIERKRGTVQKGMIPTLKTSLDIGVVVSEPQIIREEPLERENWHRNAKEALSVDGISRTLSTQSNNLITKIKEPYPSLRIRKLTPKECWRLMGFDDEDIDKCVDGGISNSQLYKQAGNSIAVNVLEEIYKELYKAIPEIFTELKVSSFFSGIGAFEKALDNFYKGEEIR